jgi:hypothetical protein
MHKNCKKLIFMQHYAKKFNLVDFLYIKMLDF